MIKFSKEAILKMDARDVNKYYVYGLLDPRKVDRNNIDYSKAFYVGKGCGNRVFHHAKAAIKVDKNEDDISLKISTIREIIDQKEEVICVIYRWGLTEEEALIVESVLIDCLPGLTNAQMGYQSSDYGKTTVEDLQKRLDVREYDEPKEDYIIIKTTLEFIKSRGDDLYEATRHYWHAKLEKAQKYKFVLSVVKGVVQEVYEVERWFASPTRPPRIEFEGKPTTNAEMLKLKGKCLPEKYMRRGVANPFLYKRGDEL